MRQVSVLAELAKRAPEPFEYLERWRELAPHDPQVHELLLSALAQRGRVREAEEHLAAACRSFEVQGFDPQGLREIWRALREQVRVEPIGSSLPPAPAAVSDDLTPRRASIAVMPFVELAAHGAADGGVSKVFT